MKALMVNSLDNSNITQIKMRDELYMKHLRQVQMINNRSPEQIMNDVKTYKSINNIHQKNKLYAFDWNNKQVNASIDQSNGKIQKKIKQIRSYFHNKSIQQHPKIDQKPKQVQFKDPETNKPATEDTFKQKSQEKKHKKKLSLHYRYREKLQYNISIQNQRLQKVILSQRSSYHLPRIAKINRTNVSTSKQDVQNQLKPKE